MARTAEPRPWLESARNHIQSGQEWKEFTGRLFDAVQQQMDENHVDFFTDLSETEKAFVLERAARAIRGGDLHNALMAQISSCLEEQLYSHVARELQDGQIPQSKSDLVLGHLRDGVVNLLEKRPDLKGKLRALFNQPLPTPLRGRAWRLCLANTKVRMEYLSQVAVNKSKSTLDRDISLQCLSVLSAEQTIEHLKDNKLAVRAMRNVLSYSHKIQNLSADLPEEEYLLVVPLVQAAIDSASPGASTDTVSALLVEEYLTFLDLRPQAMRASPNQEPAGTGSIYEDVALLVNQMDQELASTIQRIYSQQDDQPEESLQRGVQSILQPVVQRLFTGYLQIKTLLYIWDQYLLGLDQAAYSCLPAFSLTFILLLRGHLKACGSHSEVEAVLRTQGPTLSIQEFQAVINKHFYRELFSTLNKEDTEPLIIHDPTQGVPQWTHATRRAVLPRTRPQDRRQAREERELLRRQHLEKLREEENLRRLREEEQKRQEELRLQRLLEDTKQTMAAQRSQMEDQLSQEKQFRYEMQKKAEEQITQLQAEIRRLRERRVSLDGYSLASLTAPPPSEHSETPSPPAQPPPPSPGQRPAPTVVGETRRDVRGTTAETVTLDLMKQLLQSADSMANGHSEAERDFLNTATKEHLQNHCRDVRNAEVELFGHELGPGELENIPEPKRTELRKRLSIAVRRGAEARYKAQIATEGRTLTEAVPYSSTL